MAKLTIGFGVLLVLLGIAGFVYTGSTHPTALIPCVIGLFFATAPTFITGQLLTVDGGLGL